ncbi:cob(I)yrinic acid a,c-diamide adenosyltransferase [Roseospira visakhapatnamensis]|uniref:Corrinoid adenosyltransferase n=1 Tax=Roseospira visakhapatnamensis TaxID=390880 RepID=A0A7W6REC1_9PROT|nr:cob(I)yrinic acid a,c-diamide adenosyltransferase [Roseospira visakhapatnamensis]MBB4266918.1 cob(I)alamin adenosyltransferase [Roseospira visakhapatnamensis]
MTEPAAPKPPLETPAEAAESSESTDDRHAAKMRKKKAARDRMMAGKDGQKGVLLVHTGPGKGKTTASLGMVLRCIGHGMPVGIVQFIKGAMDTAERRVLEGFPDLVTIRAMGEGFTWETQDRARDVAAAEQAWDVARGMLADPKFAMVVLDELNVVLRYGYLPLDRVLEAIADRPPMQHVVVTGRNAAEPMIEAADLVTEMKLVKHPFRSGVKGQKGLEY